MLLTSTTRKANKVHQCSLCLLNIEVGESYVYQSYIDDYFYTWKSHLECDKEIGLHEDDGDGFPEGALVSYIDNYDLSEEWKQWYEFRTKTL